MAISLQELESYLWEAAVLLRGSIDPGEYKSIIFPLMFFKRLSDVYDEEFNEALQESDGDREYAAFPEHHWVVIPEGSHWSDVRQITTDIGAVIKSAMVDIEKANPDKLEGIFGDAVWTNKNRLSDKILIDLIEHFSSQNLSLKNVPQDEFGTAYEYLIKKFADDSGHNAAEFYTNRTVARLMTKIANPQPKESVYDPTCGSGGLLLDALLYLKEQGKEYRNLILYGQEINTITSAIARMNMYLHGVEDFQVVRGDTLSNPAFLENDKTKKFNVILANPPYSMKKWNRNAWIKDPYGRNIYGTPPQGNADYAFFQHIIASLDDNNGRCAILWPQGILSRDAEFEVRKNMVEDDVIEGVIALGKNLFYNSSMESCIVVCNKNKSKELKNKIHFIDAREEITAEKNFAYLGEKHITKILDTYKNLESIDNFAKLSSIEEISENGYSLNVKIYVENGKHIDYNLLNNDVEIYTKNVSKSSLELKNSFEKLNEVLDEVVKNE